MEIIVGGWLILCVAVAVFAGAKGRNPVLAFLAAFFLSPLIGFIIVAGLADKAAAAQQAGRSAAHAAPTDTRPCPHCAETIKAAAVVCRFCNREVEPVAKPSPQAAPVARTAAQRHDDAVMGWVFGGLLLVVAGFVFWNFAQQGANGGATYQTVAAPAPAVSAVDRCIEKGVAYFKEIDAWPTLSDGRSAKDVARDRCWRTTGAFDTH